MYMHYWFWESYLYPTCSTPKLEGRYVTPEALRCWTSIPTKWAKQPMFNPKRIHLASCPGCFLDLLMNSESSTVCTVLIHGFSMWLPRFWTSDGRWKKVGWKWPVIGAIGFQKKMEPGKISTELCRTLEFLMLWPVHLVMAKCHAKIWNMWEGHFTKTFPRSTVPYICL